MLPSFLYVPFAYTRTMELFLFLIVNMCNAICAYMALSFVLNVYMTKITRAQMAFLVSSVVIFEALWVYLPYALSGFRGLGRLQYFVTTPNPAIGIMGYFLYVWLLKMPRYRAIHLVTCQYLVALLLLSLSRTVNFAIFPPQAVPYNYMFDVVSALTSLIIPLVMYAVAMRLLKKTGFAIDFTNNLYTASLPKLALIALAATVSAYIIVVFGLTAQTNASFVMALVSIIIAMAIVMDLYMTSRKVDRANIQNMAVHINTLTQAVNEFRAVKHDFYNVLATYSGYIFINDLGGLKSYHEKLMKTTVAAGDQLELTRRMEQNPALCSLLLRKSDEAARQGVRMNLALNCAVNNLAIDELDLARLLACLLDNAIEAAIETETRQVSLTLEQKPRGDKLFVITNFTREDVDTSKITRLGYTTKEGHNGIGLAQMRSIISKYKNCGMHFICYEKKFSAYLEIRNPANLTQRGRK